MTDQKQPLPPVFCNMRARIEEHTESMRAAQKYHGTVNICPDCYLPPRLCIHLSHPYKW